MQALILIVTPTAGFGGLIQQTLEMAGYQPVLARDAGRAIEQARRASFSLAILDADLENTDLSQLGEDLRKLLPGLRLISTPPCDDSQVSQNFTPDAILNKPFYLPDLLEMVEKLARSGPVTPLPGGKSTAPDRERIPDVDDGGGPPPPWLQDEALAVRRLARLAPEPAQAAFILRHGELWVRAGQLPEEAAEELAQTAMQSWSQGEDHPGGQSNLARFVRLRSVEGEFMLYATRLAAGMVLALAFDAGAPFSKIRTQAASLARALMSPPGEEEPLFSQPSNEIETEESELREQVAAAPPFLPPDLVPPPTPGHPVKRSAAPSVPGPERPSPQTIIDLGEIEVAQTFAAIFEQETDSSLAVAQPADLQIERPGNIEEAARPVDLMGSLEYQQLPSGVYLLSYACVLIPRLPQHHLTGSLPVRLADWVQQLNLSFGWRLETLSIRPDYLMWISQVTPDTSAGQVVKVMRRHTSQHIFEEFPLLARDNPSVDFWASGYLAITTSQPPPPQVLIDFVAQTRRRQGVPGAGRVLPDH